MSHECTAESFLKDVAGHNMTVKMDNGIYRHLLFKAAKDSWNQWFEIITWPGVLTVHGDMGCWTFSRVSDMFTFFREEKLEINPDYWAEKLQHGTHGGRDGAKVWNEDLFRKHLVDQLTNYYSLEGEDLEVVTQALKDEVLCHDNKYDLLIATRDFSCLLPSKAEPLEDEHSGRLGGCVKAIVRNSERRARNDRFNKFQFDSCELPDGKEYAYHFLWGCYSVVWAIQKYDAMHAQYNATRTEGADGR